VRCLKLSYFFPFRFLPAKTDTSNWLSKARYRDLIKAHKDKIKAEKKANGAGSSQPVWAFVQNVKDEEDAMNLAMKAASGELDSNNRPYRFLLVGGNHHVVSSMEAVAELIEEGDTDLAHNVKFITCYLLRWPDFDSTTSKGKRIR
jgi:hypothetical protein